MGTLRTAQRNKSLVKATGVCAVLIEATMLSLMATQVLPDFQGFFCCFSESLNRNDLAENYMQQKTAIEKEWTSQPSPDLICSFKSFSHAVN